jgi:hypothetical protein
MGPTRGASDYRPVVITIDDTDNSQQEAEDLAAPLRR